jgi:predicted HicB family RNase H-like nuclease
MARKSVRKIATKGADQYMLRLPPGLRDQVARRATENGRSMNTEIIDAIEKHLKEADRVTRLWEAFEKHRANIEAIDLIYDAVDYLEDTVGKLTAGDFYGVLNRAQDEEKEAARLAKLPPITAEQAATIRELINETAVSEDSLLRAAAAGSIEEIKDFEKAVTYLERWRVRRTDVRLD